MNKVQHKHTISGVFVFLLLGIFAISSTVMVLIGASAYNGSTERSAEHNEERLASAYVRGRLREADRQGVLDPEQLDGADMLKIINDQDGTATVLYVYDGMLYEWFTLKSLAERFEGPEQEGTGMQAQGPDEGEGQGSGVVVVQSARGESVCALDEMSVSMEGNLLTVRLRNGQEWTSVDYAVRSAGN